MQRSDGSRNWTKAQIKEREFLTDIMKIQVFIMCLLWKKNRMMKNVRWNVG